MSVGPAAAAQLTLGSRVSHVTQKMLLKGKYSNPHSPSFFLLFFSPRPSGVDTFGGACQVCSQSRTISAEALQSVPGSTEEQAASRWREGTSGKVNFFFTFRSNVRTG